jgi:hypothetical protein
MVGMVSYLRLSKYRTCTFHSHMRHLGDSSTRKWFRNDQRNSIRSLPTVAHKATMKMKLATLISLSSLSQVITGAHEIALERHLQSLEQRYVISEPTFSYDTLQFDFEYHVSDFMSDLMVNYEIYDSHACMGNNDTVSGNAITENDYLLPRLRSDLQEVGDGSGQRMMKLSLNMDAETIKDSPIFADFGNNAVVRFCVRFMNYNMDYTSPFAYEINFIETPVYLQINLLNDFDVHAQVTSPDVVLAEAYQDSAVIAYLCDYDDNVLEHGTGRNQGESVRVCVKPTAEVLASGGYLKFIEEFTFDQYEHHQVSIRSGTHGEAANQLTEVSCTPGSELCAFETLLSAEFFVEQGVVNGTGTAYLQLGRETIESERRRLQFPGDSDEAREHPQHLLDARPTKFYIEIQTMPVDDLFDASGARPFTFLLYLGVAIAPAFFVWL